MAEPSSIAILASGTGSTAEAFMRAGLGNSEIPRVRIVITNNPDAGVLERVRELNGKHGLQVTTAVINSRTHPDDGEAPIAGAQTAREESAIIEALQNAAVDAVVLMGYMKRIGARLVHEFGWRTDYDSPYAARLLNTHPGLLPETKGLYGIRVQRYVLEQKLPFGGQTLHVVSENYDEGPVLAEHKVNVEPDDTPEILFERVKAAEKRYLPSDVAAFVSKRRQYLLKSVKN